MTFPVVSVPDGAVFGPHHAYVVVLVVLFAVFVVADNYARREPLVATASALLALLAFATVWPPYHGTGAALALTGCTLALAAVCWRGGMWTGYPLRWRLLAVVGTLVALDDVAEHAFGIGRPSTLFGTSTTRSPPKCLFCLGESEQWCPRTSGAALLLS